MAIALDENKSILLGRMPYYDILRTIKILPKIRMALAHETLNFFTSII
jgi:hypothetical protein